MSRSTLSLTFAERHHVLAVLGALLVLVIVGVVSGGLLGRVLAQLVDLALDLVGTT